MYINYLLYLFVFIINDFDKSNTLTSKVFCTQDLHYLYFLTDSTVQCSLPTIGGEKKYQVKQDSLSILDEYSKTEFRWNDIKNKKTTHIRNLYSYKIIVNNSDSLFILYSYLSIDSVSKIDTLKFIDAEKLREPITNFKFFNYNLRGDFQFVDKDISVDSVGNLVIYNQDKLLVPGKKIKVKLSKEELKKFISILSFAQPSKLPRDIGPCAPDPVYHSYLIVFDDKFINSRACQVSSFHYFFLNSYLDKLEEKYNRQQTK